MVACRRDIRIGNHQQNAVLRTVNEPCLRTQNESACALGSNQCPRDVKAVLWQQIVEIVTRNATRNMRKASANFVSVGVAQRSQALIDPGSTAAGLCDSFQLAVACGADGNSEAIVGEDVELFNILRGLSTQHRMRTAGVVADHSSNGAVLMCRRIGSEGKVVLFGGIAQLIVDQPGFDPGVVFLRVQLEQTIEVLGEVQHDRDIAGLSSEARSSAAPQDGNAML